VSGNPLTGVFKLNDLLTDLRASAQGIADTALIERGAGWIRELEKEFPLAHRLLMSALYKEPSDVLEALIKLQPGLIQLRGNERVLEYIGQLQGKLRRPKP
jgi:hypothetical protein